MIFCHDGFIQKLIRSQEIPREPSHLHRALCSLFQPDTGDTCVTKSRQLSQQTRGLDPMLF